MRLPWLSADKLRSSLETWISTPVDDARVRILAAELNNDPVSVVNHFRRLQVESKDDPLDFSKPTVFAKFSKRLGEAVKYLLRADHDKAIPLVVDAGIIEVYIAVITDDRFFTGWPTVSNP